jgi:hypothetical protein
MKKSIPKYSDLPFEEGKTYTTKFATGEKFLLKKVIWGKRKIKGEIVDVILNFEGIYEKHPELGVCPLGGDRLIADKKYECDIDVCHKCGEPI